MIDTTGIKFVRSVFKNKGILEKWREIKSSKFECWVPESDSSGLNPSISRIMNNWHLKFQFSVGRYLFGTNRKLPTESDLIYLQRIIEDKASELLAEKVLPGTGVLSRIDFARDFYLTEENDLTETIERLKMSTIPYLAYRHDLDYESSAYWSNRSKSREICAYDKFLESIAKGRSWHNDSPSNQLRVECRFRNTSVINDFCNKNSLGSRTTANLFKRKVADLAMVPILRRLFVSDSRFQLNSDDYFKLRSRYSEQKALRYFGMLSLHEKLGYPPFQKKETQVLESACHRVYKDSEAVGISLYLLNNNAQYVS